MKINIYIGYDSREKIASEVCKFSIKKNSTIKTNIKLNLASFPLSKSYNFWLLKQHIDITMK